MTSYKKIKAMLSRRDGQTLPIHGIYFGRPFSYRVGRMVQVTPEEIKMLKGLKVVGPNGPQSFVEVTPLPV